MGAATAVTVEFQKNNFWTVTRFVAYVEYVPRKTDTQPHRHLAAKHQGAARQRRLPRRVEARARTHMTEGDRVIYIYIEREREKESAGGILSKNKKDVIICDLNRHLH